MADTNNFIFETVYDRDGNISYVNAVPKRNKNIDFDKFVRMDRMENEIQKLPYTTDSRYERGLEGDVIFDKQDNMLYISVPINSPSISVDRFRLAKTKYEQEQAIIDAIDTVFYMCRELPNMFETDIQQLHSHLKGAASVIEGRRLLSVDRLASPVDLELLDEMGD